MVGDVRHGRQRHNTTLPNGREIDVLVAPDGSIIR